MTLIEAVVAWVFFGGNKPKQKPNPTFKLFYRMDEMNEKTEATNVTLAGYRSFELYI